MFQIPTSSRSPEKKIGISTHPRSCTQVQISVIIHSAALAISLRGRVSPLLHDPHIAFVSCPPTQVLMLVMSPIQATPWRLQPQSIRVPGRRSLSKFELLSVVAMDAPVRVDWPSEVHVHSTEEWEAQSPC